VRFCRTEIDYRQSDRPWVMVTSDTYSLAGSLIEWRHQNPDGSCWSIAARYGDDGKLLEKEHSGGPAGAELYSYHYDAFGRLDRVTLRSAKQDERIFESVQYAQDGTKTRTSYPTPLDEEQRKSTGVSVEAALHSSIDTVVIMTLLDTDDRPIRKVLYDADERIIRRIGFRYDDRGLLVEEGELIDGVMQEDFRNLYRYDALGRKTEVDRHCGNHARVLRTYTYNEHGDVELEHIRQNVLLFDEGTQEWSQEFGYEYDPAGNWTRRTLDTVLHTAERRSVRIEQRELTYF